MLSLVTSANQLRCGIMVSALALVLAACSTARTVKYEEVEMVRAQSEIDEAALLNVGILIFDPGVDENEHEVKDFVFPDVRRAEARYMPYHLKKTLEDTGHWGAVWVLPQPNDAVDLLVWGRVDHSDGLDVKVRIGAWDATGQEWLNKTYDTRIPEKAYSKYRDRTRDPYQNIFNEIANDLLAERDSLSEEELDSIHTITELRFAAGLIPAAFADYLEEDDGVYSVRRLPAEGDPFVSRMRAVQEREYSFVDTLNEYYASLYYEMGPPYETWRKMSREETLNYREMKRAARMRQLLGLAAILGAVAYNANGGSNSAITGTAVLGGIEGFRSGFEKSAEARKFGDSLKELGDSFDSETEPLIVELEGQQRRLTGTIEEKYREWRRLLREIYASETGFELPADPVPDSSQPASN